MNRISPSGIPIDPRIGQQMPIGNPTPSPVPKTGLSSFDEIFSHKLHRLHFSSHAQDRLSSRNIRLTARTLEKLHAAIHRASEKGARNALILMPGAAAGDDLALVVSVENRTVITAMDGTHIRENVFTNIDSAVIAH